MERRVKGGYAEKRLGGHFLLLVHFVFDRVGCVVWCGVVLCGVLWCTLTLSRNSGLSTLAVSAAASICVVDRVGCVVWCVVVYPYLES